MALTTRPPRCETRFTAFLVSGRPDGRPQPQKLPDLVLVLFGRALLVLIDVGRHGVLQEDKFLESVHGGEVRLQNRIRETLHVSSFRGTRDGSGEDLSEDHPFGRSTDGTGSHHFLVPAGEKHSDCFQAQRRTIGTHFLSHRAPPLGLKWVERRIKMFF
jgi:hypothetical protein